MKKGRSVCRWTRVPVSRLLAGEVQKLLSLADELHKRGVLKLWERLRSARTPDGRAAATR